MGRHALDSTGEVEVVEGAFVELATLDGGLVVVGLGWVATLWLGDPVVRSLA
jgi:hypothetical protein